MELARTCSLVLAQSAAATGTSYHRSTSERISAGMQAQDMGVDRTQQEARSITMQSLLSQPSMNLTNRTSCVVNDRTDGDQVSQEFRRRDRSTVHLLARLRSVRDPVPNLFLQDGTCAIVGEGDIGSKLLRLVPMDRTNPSTQPSFSVLSHSSTMSEDCYGILLYIRVAPLASIQFPLVTFYLSWGGGRESSCQLPVVVYSLFHVDEVNPAICDRKMQQQITNRTQPSQIQKRVIQW